VTPMAQVMIGFAPVLLVAGLRHHCRRVLA
jgi:hypothetical protein